MAKKIKEIKRKNKQKLHNLHKETLKKGNWSQHEDNILLKWVKENGPYQWTNCAKLIKGRCGKQCRERWVNTLDPNVKKGNWSDEDQSNIFESLRIYFTSWSSIAKNINGRTENAIKNYFYSSIRRLRSNSVIELLRENELHKYKDKIDIVIESLNISSINYLSVLIVKLLLDTELTDQKDIILRDFIMQLLLENNTSNNERDSVIKNNTTVIVNTSDDPINNNNDNIINLKESGNHNLTENLKIFMELLNDLKYTNPSQKVKINIPYCNSCESDNNNNTAVSNILKKMMDENENVEINFEK